MKLPDKLNRKAVKASFCKLSEQTWNYLFDHEKDNGLVACRTQGWGVKHAWYATEPLMKWLVDRGYYLPAEFDEPQQPIPRNSWSQLVVKRHAMSV